jgi:hypothetical protein
MPTIPSNSCASARIVARPCDPSRRYLRCDRLCMGISPAGATCRACPMSPGGTRDTHGLAETLALALRLHPADPAIIAAKRQVASAAVNTERKSACAPCRRTLLLKTRADAGLLDLSLTFPCRHRAILSAQEGRTITCALRAGHPVLPSACTACADRIA